MFPHNATLEFDYETTARATVVTEAVTREVGEIDDDRSRATIDRDDTTVTVDIRARDSTALRAALNTWFSLVDVAERTAAIASSHLAGTDADADPEPDTDGGRSSNRSSDSTPPSNSTSSEP